MNVSYLNYQLCLITGRINSEKARGKTIKDIRHRGILFRMLLNQEMCQLLNLYFSQIVFHKHPQYP